MLKKDYLIEQSEPAGRWSIVGGCESLSEARGMVSDYQRFYPEQRFRIISTISDMIFYFN